MTVPGQIRSAALRLGLDVQRASGTAPAHLAGLLTDRGIDLVLDVGANQGQYARTLRRFGYRGAICSFEPLPAAFEVLARHSARDPLWSAHELALGAEDGEATLNVAGNSYGASSSLLPMLPRHRRAAPDSAYVEAIEVRVRRLATVWDEVVPKEAKAPLLKLDVQGLERAVLDGAAGSLAELVGLQTEISLAPLYEGAPSLRDLLERADALGMELVHIEPGFRDPGNHELLQVDGLFMRAAGGR